MTVSEKMIQAPHKLPYALAKILKSMTEIKGILKKDIKFIKADIEKVKTDKTSDAIAEHLMKNVLAGKKNNTSLLLGQAAQEHPDYATSINLLLKFQNYLKLLLLYCQAMQIVSDFMPSMCSLKKTA